MDNTSKQYTPIKQTKEHGAPDEHVIERDPAEVKEEEDNLKVKTAVTRIRGVLGNIESAIIFEHAKDNIPEDLHEKLMEHLKNETDEEANAHNSATRH
jgi:hypothetical protein